MSLILNRGNFTLFFYCIFVEMQFVLLVQGKSNEADPHFYFPILLQKVNLATLSALNLTQYCPR